MATKRDEEAQQLNIGRIIMKEDKKVLKALAHKPALKTLVFKLLGCYVVVVVLTSVGLWSLSHAIEADKKGKKEQYGVVRGFSGDTNYEV